jgi:hypothetical protein
MKKTLLFALALAVVCVMPSCEKEPNGNGQGEEPSSNKITFGNYEGMDVVTYDSIEWEYYHTDDYDKSWYIGDFVMKDPRFKFELFSELSSYPTGLARNHYNIFIGSPMLTLSFHTMVIDNEVFQHADSTVHQTDSVPIIYIDYKRTCSKIEEADPLYETYETVTLVQHGKDDELASNFTYDASSSMQLYESSMEFPYYLNPEVTEATVYESFSIAPTDCFNMPLDEAFYLGIKCKDDNRERLGWIKIIIDTDANGQYRARPLESAIQQ